MAPPLPQPLIKKRDRLLAILAGYGRVAVAYSGGVDSAVVAKAARLALGDQAIAVTAVSPSLAAAEKQDALDVAALVGIEHRLIETHELEDPNYAANPANRCYFCKTELYTRLEALLPEWGFDAIVNGANTDDLGDYRPGLQAAGEHTVKSPLVEAGLNKAEVRELAHHWDLPVWDKPASPCLSSRLAYGLAVTPERLARVEQAELFLRATLGVAELRVRHEPNDLARIEVPADKVTLLADANTRREITARLHALGFKYVTVDLDGFRSGSMNATLPLAELRVR